MSDLLTCFLWLCDQSTNYGCLHPEVYPATWCAKCTGLSLYRARKALRRLAAYGYAAVDTDGGWNDYAACIWCLRGYCLTRKGIETAIYKKYEREEIERIEESLKGVPE